MSQTFGKGYRLRTKEDFEGLRKNSFRVTGPSLIAFFQKSNKDNSRLGLSVSKKIGKANVRNRCKRILRESFRLSAFKDLGIDVLLVVKNSVSHKDDFHFLHQDAGRIFKKMEEKLNV